MKIRYTLLFISITLMISFCAASPNKAFDEDMRLLEPAVAKLTAAIQRTLSDKNFDANITDEELLRLSTKEDESLINPFYDHYSIKISREKKHAIVMICTKDEKYVWFEDLGCTDEVDMEYWTFKRAYPCDFQLSAKWCEDRNNSR
jgi:hypothetical protein